MKHNDLNFGTDRISVLFRKLFFPTLFGMVCMSAVTTIDGIFVGHGVGSDGIAAVNICVPLLMTLMGVGLMVGAGCSVIASIQLSHGQMRPARLTVTHAMLFVTIVSVAVAAAILMFPAPIARLLGASEHLLPMVIDYLVWFAPSLLFELWTAVALFAIRLDGRPNLAMWCSIISALANVVLDYLFIFPLGWGVMGAAAATSISCLLGAGVAVIYLLFGARTLRIHPLRWNRSGVKAFFSDMGEQCKIGSSALLGELTMAILLFIGNHVFMRFLGDNGVGAFGVSCYYLPFVFMIGNAIAQSAQPIISFNFGTGSNARVQSALHVSLITALICGVISTSAFALFPELLVSLFLPLDNAAAHIAAEGFPYYGIAFVFFILNLTVIGYYQSIEKVKAAVGFALLRGLVFLIPCFMLLPEAMCTKGIWLALPLSEFLSTVSILVHFEIHHGKRVIRKLKALNA